MASGGASEDKRHMVRLLLALPAAQGDVYSGDSRNGWVFSDPYHAHFWAKTYLHNSFVDQVLADDSGSSQAGVSNLGGCRVHWLHKMRSKEKGERILSPFCNGKAEKLLISKMAASQRDEGGEW